VSGCGEVLFCWGNVDSAVCRVAVKFITAGGMWT
jgi:hypothetical protein